METSVIQFLIKSGYVVAYQPSIGGILINGLHSIIIVDLDEHNLDRMISIRSTLNWPTVFIGYNPIYDSLLKLNKLIRRSLFFRPDHSTFIYYINYHKLSPDTMFCILHKDEYMFNLYVRMKYEGITNYKEIMASLMKMKINVKRDHYIIGINKRNTLYITIVESKLHRPRIFIKKYLTVVQC